MAIDDLDKGKRPEDLGGQESETSVEVDVVEAVKGWRWFWKWRGREKVEVPREAPQKSWLEQKEERNAEKADEATADLGNETAAQREIRRQNREG